MKSLVCRDRERRSNQLDRRVDELTVQRAVQCFSGHGPRDLGSRGYILYSLLCLLGAASERRRRQVRSARINLGAWRRQQVLGSRFDAPASRTSSFFFSLSLLLSSLFSLLLVSKAVYYSFKQVSVESFPINFTRLMIFYYFSKNIIRGKFRKF